MVILIYKRFLRFMLWLIVCLCSASTFAAPGIILQKDGGQDQDLESLLSYTEIFEDKHGQLTLDDLIQSDVRFEAVHPGTKSVDLLLSHSVVWLRLDITNQSAQRDWYLVMHGSLSRKVRLYVSTHLDQQQYTLLDPLKHSRGIRYRLTLPAHTPHRIYIRAQDLHAPLLLNPSLLSAKRMLLDVMLMYPLFSAVIGGLLTLAVYNLLYFFYLRDKSFLALSVFIVGFVMEMGNHAGVLFYFDIFREYFPPMGATFSLVALCAGTSLSQEWLNTKHYTPKLDQVFRFCFWLCICLIPLQYMLGYGTAIAGTVALCLVGVFMLASIVRYAQGFRFPLMLRLGIGLVLVSMMPVILRGVGLVEDLPMLADATFFILLLALTLLSLTQAEQVHLKSEQAERITIENKTKDEFLTTMSHELRTPMNAVVSAGRLLRKTSLDARQGEYVARLNTSSRHMLSLVNDILDFAKLENQMMEVETIPFSLDKVIQHVDQLLTEQARSKRLTLVVNNHFHPLSKQPQGDPTRLQQVLLNLLGNAIKFTEQGSVSLIVTPLGVTADSATLRFEVQDTGIGMSSVQQERLFQPFSQLDSSISRKYGGSGLGLAISKRLVQCMGGDIRVSSSVGLGSCFSFELSFNLQQQAQVAEVTQESLQEFSLADQQILLVDDDEMNRFFGREVLNTLGANVQVAESGEAAIQLVEQQHYDLVLMDVSMPGLDGYETVKHIRKNPRFQHLLIIALTAHAIAGEAERCLAAGMNAYLTKPFDENALKVLLLNRKQPQSF